MIIKSLLKISGDLKHPELEIILNKLRSLSPLSFENEKIEENISYDLSDDKSTESSLTKYKNIRCKMFHIEEESIDMPFFSLAGSINVTWEEVLNALK
jgi:hypothetical protein